MNFGSLKNSSVLVLIFLSLAAGCRNPDTKGSQPEMITYINDYGFSFDLPVNCRDLTGTDLGKALRTINPDLVFAAIVELTEDTMLISVSTFEMKEAMALDSAFRYNLQYKPTLAGEPVEDYRIIDYGVKESQDTKLCFKISFNPETKYSLIYYLMKNNYSNILYELKATCQEEEKLPDTQKFIETVALSARFKDR